MSCSKGIKNLKLLQWNAQGATTQSVITQIDLLLNEEKIDIAVISETFMTPGHDFRLTNYTVYRKDRPTHGGGVLIAVRNNIDHRRLPNYQTVVAEDVSIEVIVDKTAIVFTSVYVPKYTKYFASDINKITPNNKYFVALGDFNAKHMAWNCKANNRAGKVLFNLLHKSEFVMHHPDTPTHFPHCGSTPSTIDFVLTNSPVLFSNIYTIDGKLPSDHSPVICTIEGTPNEFPPNAKPNYKKADWCKYANIIESHLNSTNLTATNKEEIDAQITKFINTIRMAESESVPMERRKSNRLEISTATKDLIKLRNDTQRQWQRCNDVDLKCLLKTLLNAQNKRIKRMIRNDFNKKWSKTLSSIKPGDNKLWTLSKKMMNKNDKKIEMLKVSDQIITKDSDIAEALAEQFVQNHTITIHYRSALDDKVNKVVQSIDLIHPSTLNTSDHHVQTEEISRVISKLKIRKAPGIDGIPNILLKRLPSVAIKFLTNIINSCIDECYFPTHFKIAKVTSILKPQKDPKSAVSYRPISLLSSIGKIFERIIYAKLNGSLTANSVIEAKQFGFRPGHSTVHQIKRIVNIINANKARRKSTGMVLIDMEKAFDSVWHNGLLFKLEKAGTPTYLIKLISSFLKDRSFTVCVNGTQSSSKSIPAGLAQGSIISPLLYAVYTSDLKIPSNCESGYYADDTAILSSAKQSNTVVKNLSNALSKIHKYFIKWKIKINCEKTQAILFKFNQSSRRTPSRDLYFNGSLINFKTEVTYLGLTIDHKLNFTRQTESCSMKALNSFKALYPLLCRHSMLSTESKLMLYKTIIRPKMTYASPVWIGTSRTNHEKLKVTQNKILKCIHNVPRTFPTSVLLEISDIDHITSLLQRQTDQFFNKCAISEHDLIRRITR